MAQNQNEPDGEVYVIRLQGHLDDSWADWFDGLTFTHESDGTTTLTGEILDQAALHGVLKKIRDLGLPLLSVNHLELDLGAPSKEN
jgi:hypothetical protein